MRILASIAVMLRLTELPDFRPASVKSVGCASRGKNRADQKRRRNRVKK